MTRLALVVTCAGLLLLTGCNLEEDASAAGKAGGNPAPQKNQDAPQVKTPIVRSLLKALDEAEGGTDEERDSVRQTLLDSDEELSKVLGDNSRRLIERANKKALAPMIGGRKKPCRQIIVPPKESVPPDTTNGGS